MVEEHTRKLYERFKDVPDVIKVIPWQDPKMAGVSFLKKYPPNGKFQPAVNQRGEDDTVVLIKIGYNPEEITNDRVILLVFAIKHSRYLGGNRFDYNYEDPESPTRDSLEASKESPQPVDIEELKSYEYNVATGEVYDREANKSISPAELVSNIYEEHLKTLNLRFRIRYVLHTKSYDLSGVVISFLTWLNFFLFGRQLKKSEDFSIGIFKPYPPDSLNVYQTEKTKLLGTELPISGRSAATIAAAITLVFLIEYYSEYDFLGLLALVESSGSGIISIALLVSFALLVDTLIPKAIFHSINGLIQFRFKNMNTKLKVR